MDDQLTAAVDLVERLESDGIVARALGGLGIAISCPSARRVEALARKYDDLDLVTRRESVSDISAQLEDLGFTPARRFNAVHGKTRLAFAHPTWLHLDVFVDTFSMCHVLPLRRRVGIRPLTLSPSDLILTKLQIAEINRKDVVDVAAVLLDHPLTRDDQGINTIYIGRLLASNWGWWRTVTDNMETVLRVVPQLALAEEPQSLIQQRASELLGLIAVQPRTLRWQLRSRAGDRFPWRDEPEEFAHA